MKHSSADFEYDGCQPARIAVANSTISPPLVESRKARQLEHGVLKPGEYLPLYCNPIFLFLTNWILMLASLSAKVTYVTYPTSAFRYYCARFQLPPSCLDTW